MKNITLSYTVYRSIRAIEHVQLNATTKDLGYIKYNNFSIIRVIYKGSPHKLNPNEVAEIKRECQNILKRITDKLNRYQDKRYAQF
ncbi:MAG: hypothetical protein AMR96_04000 [Candidatus Adiutrix intracellularis]|nr:MAG: hypothetical protein AMR96_04000 [Candidatus Adiutrix intracellularis]